MKKIIALMLALIMLLSFAACKNEPDTPDTPDNGGEDTVPPVPAELSATVVMKSENFSVTYGMLSCYFFDFLANFYNKYYQSLSYLGIDFSKSLKDQIYYEDKSWHEFFMESVTSTVEEMLLLAEAARDAGLSPDEDDKAEVDAAIETVKNAATAYGTSFEDYISSYYYNGVTEEILREALTLSNFAYSYYAEIYSDIEPTEEDLIAYRDANPSYFYACDYYTFLFDSKENADAMLDCDSEKEYLDRLAAYLLSAGIAQTEEEAANSATKALMSEYYYKVANDIDRWIFEDGRAAGDTATIEYTKDGETKYAAVYIKNPYYLVSEKTQNVRHILFLADSYETDDECKAEAERVFALWKDGAATEDSFAELAKAYSEDGSASIGGLYENLTDGYTVEAFNDWIFDESRQSGDTDIVLTEYGYHIMYYVSEGLPSWKATALSPATDAIYTKWLDEVKAAHTITADDTVIDKIES